MPVKSGESLDPAATKARIVAVADRVFYERGVHAVGVQEIAGQAAASKLTIYRHFGSKDGLVSTVFRTRSDRIHDWLARGMSEMPPGRERILALFDLLAEWYQQQDFRGCAMVNAAIDTRGDSGVVRNLTRQHLARYREVLASCLAEAGVSDPAPVARQLLVLIEGMTIINTVDPDPRLGRETRKTVELLVDTAIRGEEVVDDLQ